MHTTRILLTTIILYMEKKDKNNKICKNLFKMDLLTISKHIEKIIESDLHHYYKKQNCEKKKIEFIFVKAKFHKYS